MDQLLLMVHQHESNHSIIEMAFMDIFCFHFLALYLVCAFLLTRHSNLERLLSFVKRNRQTYCKERDEVMIWRLGIKPLSEIAWAERYMHECRQMGKYEPIYSDCVVTVLYR